MGDSDNSLSAGPPYSATISLPPDASAAAIARRFVEDNRDHLRPELIEDTQLLVSEIVTNAVLHGRPDITLKVRIDPPGIGIAVSDFGEDLPKRTPDLPPADQPSGRGLLIVDALSSAWGIEANRNALPGKIVWFEIGPGDPP